jgi:lipopolysaccharide heptosyltransferase I
MANNYKNILIIKPSALGDIALALPALSAIKKSFPDARISWLIRPEFAKLLEDHPYIDQLILFDRKFLGKSWYNPKAFAALIKLIKTFRDNKFDAIFDLQGLFRTAAFSWLAGCPNRFGMANARELGHIFYTKKIAQDADSLHLVDYYLKIVKASGAADLKVEFLLPEDAEASKHVRGLLDEKSLGKDYVIFVPCSAHHDKCWPQERFAELAKKIQQEFSLPVIAIGTASEKPQIDQLGKLSDANIINMAGDLNLKQLVEILRNAKLVVSNDTGPGHIAAALASPLILLYGWSNPNRISPYNRPECMLAGGLDSRGVKIRSDKPEHSVTAITVEQAYEKAIQQLTKAND